MSDWGETTVPFSQLVALTCRCARVALSGTGELQP
jgi:hypothetical protein